MSDKVINTGVVVSLAAKKKKPRTLKNNRQLAQSHSFRTPAPEGMKNILVQEKNFLSVQME